jgi:RNA polymerase sigma-70 factor, ECF subfamily
LYQPVNRTVAPLQEESNRKHRILQPIIRSPGEGFSFHYPLTNHITLPSDTIMNFAQLKEDRTLIRRVASGDRAAFDEFFREYFPRLFRFTVSRVDHDETLAEEIVQRTMCIVVRKAGTYRGEALLFTWLCQICRNETFAVLKARGIERQRNVPLEDNPGVRAALESLSVESDEPDSIQQSEEVARFVRTTLEYLPTKYATALEMKYIQGCSVAEIGKRLNVGSKAAESILSRARAAFKEAFRSLWDFEPNFIVD